MTNEAVESVLGYAPHELNNKNLSLIFAPEDLTYLYPNLLQLGRKNQPFQGEILLVKKNGVSFFTFIVFRSFNDHSLNKSFNFICIRDIDAQKQLEKASAEANHEDLVKVANGVAHELRNPLMAIGGFVNRLYNKCNAIHEHGDYYDHIITNLKKIENIVRKVEFLAKLPKPSFTMENTQSLIQKAIQPYLPILEKRKINLKTPVDPTLLKMDGKLVIRVLSIFMDNALDALPDDGNIVIHGATNNNHCEIEFSDTGRGISAEDLPFIFNPFFSTKADGAGIDLAIVKRIMESHGGSVKVRSEEGHGASFILRFPLERRRAIRISRI